MCRWRIPLSGSLKVWNDTNWYKFKSSKLFQTSETSFPNLLMFWLQNVKQILFKRWKKWRMLYWLTWTVLPETQALNSIPASATTFLVHEQVVLPFAGLFSYIKGNKLTNLHCILYIISFILVDHLISYEILHI